MTVLLTRPEADNAEISAVLEAEGIATIAWPLMRIETVAEHVVLPMGCRGIVATSGNGVRSFAALSPERDLPVLAVGDRTASLARDLGFADAESAAGTVEDLARLAAERGLSPLYHPTGAVRRGDLAALLAPHGIDVTVQTLYRMRASGAPSPAVDDALREGKVTVATLWSPENANLFQAFVKDSPAWRLGCTAAIAISPAAAEPLDRSRFAAVRPAARPDRTAMIEAVVAAHAAMRR